MRYPEFKWIEFAKSGAQNRGNVQTVDDVISSNGTPDCYRTIFRYPDGFKAHFDTSHTVKGYRGLVYADFFPMDIDCDDLTKAHQDIRILLNSLLNRYEIDLDTIYVYFSGAKGFHVLIPGSFFDYQPSESMPLIFREMAKEIGEGIKYDTTIYDWVRIFRMTNTVNSKSGLYKIPLTPSEVLNLSIEEIKVLAKKQRAVKTKSNDRPNEYLRELYRSCQEKAKRPARKIRESGKKIIPPKYAKLCYYHLMEGVESGNRDNACLRLAVHWLKEFPEDMVKNMLYSWNQQNNPPMDERQVDKVFNSALTGDYDFGCKDSVLSSYCDPGCKFKGKEEEPPKITAEKIYTIDEAKVKYEEYIRRLRERKIVIGFKKLDGFMRGIAPGEVCEIVARTGVGKTAFLLNIIRNVISSQGIPILFFSLEQPLAQIYERTVQISTDESGIRVEKGFSENASESLHYCVKNVYGSLYTVDEDMLTYEELKEYILIAARDKIGQIPPLVCIDYLGRMRGGRGTPYEITSELARLMKKLAKELDIAVIYLHQTSRMGKTGAEEITLDMSRDSGVCEEAADFILGMWRPDLNKQESQDSDEERMVISVLKNRKGKTGKSFCKFKKSCLQITEDN